MAGKPAVCVGDQTAHGGVITGPGCPTVLIGGKPAAVMGDMHTCPMVTPGVPPVPHVGATVMATGVLVLIGGKPAARMGDTAICTGPPDACIVGNPMVLIGDGGAGGGGAGMGQAAKKATGSTAAVEDKESHYLDVKFKDKGGKPITGVNYTVKGPDGRKVPGKLAGQIKKVGVEEGSYEIELKAITDAKWSKESAKLGDKVKLQADMSGIEDGTDAEFNVYVSDINFPEEKLTAITTKVSGEKAEAEWELKIDKDLLSIQDGKEKKKNYSSPSFCFEVIADGTKRRSKYITYKAEVKIKLKDKDGKPVKNAKYRVKMPNGKIVSDKLDSKGEAKIKNVPPGRVRVSYEPKKK